MAMILTIDLGTTYFKIALFDRSGRLCDTHRLPLRPRGEKPGWQEVAVETFCDLIAQGIAELRTRSKDRLADVEAITFATQTNSFVLLGGEGQPLTPIILWIDRRVIELEAAAVRRCDFADFAATTGLPLVNYQFMIAKLLWLQRHRPEVWRQTRRLCLISDYLTHLLAGQYVTEAGAAALTGLVDIHRCCWWPEMLSRFEISGRWLSRVVRAGTDLGPITRPRPRTASDCRGRAGLSSAASTSMPGRSAWATSSRG